MVQGSKIKSEKPKKSKGAVPRGIAVKTEPKDPTAAARTAALKERLQVGGGKRMSLNLDGNRVRKLDKLVKDGVGNDHSDVIRKLIDDANYD